MRSKKLFFFIISTFLLFTKSSYSENLAYVDIEFIMNNSLAGKSITQNLEKNTALGRSLAELRMELEGHLLKN